MLSKRRLNIGKTFFYALNHIYYITIYGTVGCVPVFVLLRIIVELIDSGKNTVYHIFFLLPVFYRL